MRARTPAQVVLACEKNQDAAAKQFWSEGQDCPRPSTAGELFEKLEDLRARYREAFRIELTQWEAEIRAEERERFTSKHKLSTCRICGVDVYAWQHHRMDNGWIHWAQQDCEAAKAEQETRAQSGPDDKAVTDR